MTELCDGAREMLESHSDYDPSKLVFNSMDFDGIYSIYDKCTGVYCTPFVMDNDNAAMRSFEDYCSVPDTSLFKHSEDYDLYCLGEYSKKDGSLVSLPKPRLVARASLIVYSVKQKLGLLNSPARGNEEISHAETVDCNASDLAKAFGSEVGDL